MHREFYAHIRKHGNFTPTVSESAQECQPLSEHLLQVAALAQKFSAKANLGTSGKLMGLLHDLGKYSYTFQNYLLSAEGMIDQDKDEYIDAAAHKGKIDHSTAGAQYVFERCTKYGKGGKLYGRLLALGMASHHSGLINYLNVDGSDAFGKRINKDSAATHLDECRRWIEPVVLEAVESLFMPAPIVLEDLNAWRVRLFEKYSSDIAAFRFGLLIRFLLSCLRDADCIDSACFEHPELKAVYYKESLPDWKGLSAKLECELSSKNTGLPLNVLRREIAADCLARARDKPGLFTLTVPTGGGKTLSSLRFALNHAQEHNLEHVFYIIPYTSIIDQNAKETSDILESGEEAGSIVLEHHSNILPE